MNQTQCPVFGDTINSLFPSKLSASIQVTGILHLIIIFIKKTIIIKIFTINYQMLIIDLLWHPMKHDYSLLVENLKKRRYDEVLGEPVLSGAFHQSGYSDCLRYTLESMNKIDPSYAHKVYASSRKIQEQISESLKKRGYRH